MPLAVFIFVFMYFCIYTWKHFVLNASSLSIIKILKHEMSFAECYVMSTVTKCKMPCNIKSYQMSLSFAIAPVVALSSGPCRAGARRAGARRAGPPPGYSQ